MSKCIYKTTLIEYVGVHDNLVTMVTQEYKYTAKFIKYHFKDKMMFFFSFHYFCFIHLLFMFEVR